MTRLDSGSATLVGKVRSANEDSLLVTERLVAVADGMGGHRGGEVASADAVDVLAGVSDSHSLEDLVLAVHMANRRINDRSAEDEALRGMGTTVCAVGLVDSDGEQLAILNVGDSRVYLFADGELRQLTEDHSLVETLVREGRISAEEAETHPQRNVLTRALGVEPLIVVDAWLLAPCDGDRLLLCSDGLFNELSRERITEILAESDNAEVTARRLAAEAESAGGRDNITTVVADVFDTGQAPAPAGDRVRRIATPTVDLDDTFDDVNRTATVPMVPISPTPQRDADAESASVADGEVRAAGVDEADPDEPDSESARDDRGDVDGVGDYGDGDRGAPSDVDDPTSVDDDTDSADPSESAPEPASEAATRSGFTWRTALFILAVLAVLAIPVGILLWNAGQGYLIKGSGDTVVLYRGSSGGFLWVQPEELKSHRIIVDDLPPRYRDDVIAGKTYTDEAEAERYIRNLEREADLATTTTTSTTTTTTSTTTTTAPTTTAPTTAAPVTPTTAPVPPSTTP